jgi:hypothetical protein
MSKMSRGLQEFIDRFSLAEASRGQAGSADFGRGNARRAAAGAQY